MFYPDYIYGMTTIFFNKVHDASREYCRTCYTDAK